MIETVMCYLFKDDDVLMLYRNKKKDDMNGGKYIGVGGHIEKGETKDEAIKREVKEETNFNLINYEYRGFVTFYNNNYEEKMYIYTSSSFDGEMKECDEGTLKWVKKDELSSLNMWEGDKYFIELIEKDIYDFELELFYEESKFKSYRRIK